MQKITPLSILAALVLASCNQANVTGSAKTYAFAAQTQAGYTKQAGTATRTDLSTEQPQDAHAGRGGAEPGAEDGVLHDHPGGLDRERAALVVAGGGERRQVAQARRAGLGHARTLAEDVAAAQAVTAGHRNTTRTDAEGPRSHHCRT